MHKLVLPGPSNEWRPKNPISELPDPEAIIAEEYDHTDQDLAPLAFGHFHEVRKMQPRPSRAIQRWNSSQGVQVRPESAALAPYRYGNRHIPVLLDRLPNSAGRDIPSEMLSRISSQDLSLMHQNASNEIQEEQVRLEKELAEHLERIQQALYQASQALDIKDLKLDQAIDPKKNKIRGIILADSFEIFLDIVHRQIGEVNWKNPKESGLQLMQANLYRIDGTKGYYIPSKRIIRVAAHAFPRPDTEQRAFQQILLHELLHAATPHWLTLIQEAATTIDPLNGVELNLAEACIQKLCAFTLPIDQNHQAINGPIDTSRMITPEGFSNQVRRLFTPNPPREAQQLEARTGAPSRF